MPSLSSSCPSKCIIISNYRICTAKLREQPCFVDKRKPLKFGLLNLRHKSLVNWGDDGRLVCKPCCAAAPRLLSAFEIEIAARAPPTALYQSILYS